MIIDKIALLIVSIALIVYAIRGSILSYKLNKFQSNINGVKHLINSIDMNSISTPCDRKYLSEAKKFLRDM